MKRATTETADIPHMTEKQFSRAKKLLRRLCANYDRGNCLLLDDGYDACPCPSCFPTPCCAAISAPLSFRLTGSCGGNFWGRRE